MQTFLVGGAVRDLMLGLTPKDRDYVVVGGTAEAMTNRGFLQVGKDFPVFLHPLTRDEYALARIERKTGAGHTGFSVSTQDVTLEEDLSRRDLTINSMAMALTGTVIDPFGGRADLAAKTLRHTSAAFEEDPLRVLRVARFAARFGPEWRADESLTSLMSRMVGAGALTELPFERIWAELQRGLMEEHPTCMVTMLKDLGLLSGPQAIQGFRLRDGFADNLARAVAVRADADVRFACAFELDGGAPLSKMPREVSDLAFATQRAEAAGIRWFDQLSVEEKLVLLDSLDILRRADRFNLVVLTLQLMAPFPTDGLRTACRAIHGINYAALASGLTGLAVKQRIANEKLAVLSACFPA